MFAKQEAEWDKEKRMRSRLMAEVFGLRCPSPHTVPKVFAERQRQIEEKQETLRAAQVPTPYCSVFI